MLRNILSVVVGIIASFLIISLFEFFGYFIYPMPDNFNKNDPGAMKEFIANAPTVVMYLILVGYALGSFVGSLVASIIATKNKMRRAISVGSILMGFGILNLFSFPHPTWMIICTLLVFLPFAFIGGKLALVFSNTK